MNKKLVKEFREELKRYINFYQQDIENIELRLKETQGKNGYNVNPMLSDRSKIGFLLNYLKNIGTDKETFQLEKDIKILNFLDEKSEKIKKRKDFQAKCLEELESLANRWEYSANSIFSDPEDFMHDLECRDECEAIVREINSDRKASKIREKIKKADTKLQKKCLDLLKRFKDFYESGEWDYYPKTYWWRHLKEFVEKKGENND